MNYKLAKQLAKAGFPQKEPNNVTIYVAGKVYIPTLSELIEALPKITEDGWVLTIEANCAGWTVEQRRKGRCRNTFQMESLEETISKLWIKINENKNRLKRKD